MATCDAGAIFTELLVEDTGHGHGIYVSGIEVVGGILIGKCPTELTVKAAQSYSFAVTTPSSSHLIPSLNTIICYRTEYDSFGRLQIPKIGLDAASEAPILSIATKNEELSVCFLNAHQNDIYDLELLACGEDGRPWWKYIRFLPSGGWRQLTLDLMIYDELALKYSYSQAGLIRAGMLQFRVK